MIPSFDRSPYSLPLSDAEFERAIRRGFGRAVLHAQRFGLGPHREMVLSACMKNGAMDTQCEDDRSRFMFDVLRAVPERAELFAELRRRIWAVDANDEAYEWEDLSQQARIVRMMAEHGDSEAKPFLYRLMARDPWSHCPAGTAIIALDGFDGLVWVCERLGEALASGLLDEADAYPLSKCEGLDDEEAALKALEPRRWANPALDRYLAHLEAPPIDDPLVNFAEHCEKRDHEFAEMTFDDILEYLTAEPDALSRQLLCRRWFREADPHDRTRFIEAVVMLEDVSALQAGLWAIWRNEITEFHPGLFRFVDHPDDGIARLACYVHERVSHPSVCEAALEGLTQRAIRRGSLALFVANFQPSDAQRICEALFVFDDEGDAWRCCGDLEDIAERNLVPECVPLLLFAYEHQPSTLRRQGLLELLNRLGPVPGWIKAEAVFDPDEGTRELALTS